MQSEFPEMFAFLFEPHRYKVGWGGRGGMKTYAFTDALLIEGTRQFERILCARENMNSIKESVHQVLESRIKALGLQRHYQVLQSTILGPSWGAQGQTEFIFAGLRHNIDNIKSLEGATKVWVEEAANVSKDSWAKLVPTVRWEDKATGRKSEIWVTFNPEMEADETYQRFVLNPPTDAVVVKTDYRDNPWLPEVLRIEMEDLKAKDHAAYEHVWLGQCKSVVEGAIFGEEMRLAEADGRIWNVPADRTKPVHTFWDLGFGDKTAIWFAQAVDGWFQIVDYLENSGKTIEWYMIQLQNRGYLYGADWLPHDAVDTIIHTNLAGGDKTRSIEQLMRAAGRKVRIAPKLYVNDRLNAARTIFSQCRFDRQKCVQGLDALKNYQWGEPDASDEAKASGRDLRLEPKTKRKPLHNFASHGADAFCTLAVSIKQPMAERKVIVMPEEDYSWMG